MALDKVLHWVIPGCSDCPYRDLFFRGYYRSFCYCGNSYCKGEWPKLHKVM